MNKIILLLILFFANINLFAKEPVVDCLILADENSIICKYTLDRVDYDKKISFVWLEPNGNITRKKDLLIPAGHGSIYDYRYIEGRALGTWGFEVIDGNTTLKTTFILE